MSAIIGNLLNGINTTVEAWHFCSTNVPKDFIANVSESYLNVGEVAVLFMHNAWVWFAIQLLCNPSDLLLEELIQPGFIKERRATCCTNKNDNATR